MTKKLIFKSIFDEEDNEPLADGTAVRVPMTMMDDRRRGRFSWDDPSEIQIVVTDTFDTRPKSSLDAKEKERRNARQAAYDMRVSDAWRSPTPPALRAPKDITTEVAKVLASPEHRFSQRAAPPTTTPRVDSPFATDATRAYDAKVSEAWRIAR